MTSVISTVRSPQVAPQVASGLVYQLELLIVSCIIQLGFHVKLDTAFIFIYLQTDIVARCIALQLLSLSLK